MTQGIATVDDLRVLYPAYTDDMQDRAVMLLDFAEASARSICVGDIDDQILKMVVIQATIRALQAGGDTPIGVTQTSWAASPFSGSMTYSNPSGDLYFTAQEKRLLHADTGAAFFINQRISTDVPET